MNGSSLTLEDILAAARCIAVSARAGRDPDGVAHALVGASGIALAMRIATGRAHPRYGDGSLSAAAAAFGPVAPLAPAIGVSELLAAIGVLARVWAKLGRDGL